MMKLGTIMVIGSMSACLAVAIGAFGAHGASSEQAKAWIVTGSGQHMAHSLAIFACAFVVSQASQSGQSGQSGQGCVLAVWLFLAGITLFSGSLYALALGAPKAVAMVAPFGGLSFMVGWVVLALAGLKLNRNAS
jgi:uncharacterized membrane protein YgdD (TMEM256/DUF423 family)